MLRTPPQTKLGGNSLIVTTSPVEDLQANLVQIDYNTTYGTIRYLQVFSGKAVPANGTVPITAPITTSNRPPTRAVGS